MVHIFHGSDPNRSRIALNQAVDSFKNHSLLRLEGKEVTLDLVNSFLNATSLFADEKLLVLLDYFQQSAPTQKLITPLIAKTEHPVLIYSPKALTPTQLKLFPQARVAKFSLSSTMFQMLSALRPNNGSHFFSLLNKTLATQPPELIAFMLRRKLRELIQRPSGFNPGLLKATYLELIDADFNIKSGKLPLPLDILIINSLSRLM